MKTNLTYCLLIAVILGGCTQQKPAKIEGAWKLVYNKTVYDDTLYYSFPGKDTTEGQIKMWTKDHVSFTGKIIWEDKYPGDNFGAGSYKLIGNQYEETFLYCSYKPFIGQTLKLKLEIKNDTLIQTTLENDGKFNKSSYMIEKYVKF